MSPHNNLGRICWAEDANNGEAGSGGGSGPATRKPSQVATFHTIGDATNIQDVRNVSVHKGLDTWVPPFLSEEYAKPLCLKHAFVTIMR